MTCDNTDEQTAGWRAALEKATTTGSALSFFKDVVKKDQSQQLTATCIFCWQAVTSTGSTRLAGHLQTKCVACPKEVKEKFSQIRNKVDHKRKLEAAQIVMAEEERQRHELKMMKNKSEGKQLTIAAATKQASKESADRAIARFFYANGIPFSVASHEADCYYRQMVAAIQSAGSGYVAPGAKTIGGRLLDDCYTEMLSDSAKQDPDSSMAIKFGRTYVSDGWEDINHTPLINSAYITANNGGTYLRSVDTSGATKDAAYLAKLMIEDILEIGATTVIAVCTDTCNSMKAAWRQIEAEFPWIFCVPCQAHCASLLSKDIGTIEEVATTVKEETMLSGWFLNHQKPLAILRECTKNILKKSLELRRAAATRFGTNTLVGARQLELKSSLQASVVSEEYQKMQYKDLPDAIDQGNGVQMIREQKGATVRNLILDDSPNGFWHRVKEHVSFTAPVLRLIRRHDSSAPSVGKVYHGWFEVGKSMEDSTATYAARGKEKFDQRWAYSHCDLFSAAYVLDPEFISHDQASNSEVMDGFLDSVEKIGILLAVREDMEKGLYDCANVKRDAKTGLPQYPSPRTDTRVKEYCKRVNQQLSFYRGKKGIFSREYVIEAAEAMPAHLWWEQYGSSVPELQCLAMLVLAQPASASVCERINSEYAFIVDRRRNRLDHTKADKLVSLFHNLRLKRSMNKVRYVEPLIGWGDGQVESFGISDEPGMNMLKVEV